jgi:hypothetical protein
LAISARVTLVALVAGALALAAATPAAAQCAMCKAAIEGSTDGNVGAQFNRAILVMMAGPYLIAGVFGLVFWREPLRDATRRLLSRLRRLAGPRR